ncbi:MAG: hypothetical protein PVI80_16745, partial [Anaerolineae bacterium]
MGLKTTVARIAVAGGGLYDQPDNILVSERVSPFGKGRGRGNLYILVELSGPELGRDVVMRQLVQEMRRAYYGWRGSVTAGLRQAILLANDLLLEENRNSLPGEQRLGGTSCAVLRNEDLFIAQAGPAAIYLYCKGEVNRYPDPSPWLDGFPPEEMDASALGERHELNIDLFHSQMSDGDTLLMVDSQLAKEVGPQSRPEFLAQSPVNVVLENLYAAGGGRVGSSLVVRMGEEEVGTVQIEAPAPAMREPETFKRVAVPPVVLDEPQVAAEPAEVEPAEKPQVPVEPVEVEPVERPPVPPAAPKRPRRVTEVVALEPQEAEPDREPRFNLGARFKAVMLA